MPRIGPSSNISLKLAIFIYPVHLIGNFRKKEKMERRKKKDTQKVFDALIKRLEYK